MQPDPTSLFTWLHLSDIHHQHGDATTRWDQVLVLDRLRADIALGASRRLPKPDAILVTGDIAYSGNVRVIEPDTESREYEKAKSWLESICQAVGLPADKVFMVPGNHDVRRVSPKERQTLRLIDAIRAGQERIDEAISNIADRQHLLARLDNYAAFAESFAPVLSADNSVIMWRESIAANGIRVRLVGLNTALLANDSEDEKRLFLGNWQLAEAALAPANIDCSSDVVVVLTHHPLDWLGDGGSANDWMSTVAHVHLCGHIHAANISRIRTSGGKDHVTITAGASHDDSGAPSGHGYSLASIVRYDDGRVALRVWPRIWSSKNKDFRVDVDNLPEDSSYFECDLRLRLEPMAPQPTVHVAESETPDDGQDATGDTTAEVAAPNTSSITSASDAPPVPAAWVGRTQEIELFDDPQVAVIGITGIGGQGKSALAARYIEKSGSSYEFWDWRDCREEGDTLQTHIVRAIERLSQGRIVGTAISNEDIESHVGLLFQSIGQRRVLMVFDNIDHYVDTESNKAILGMRLLIEAALRRSHVARIIVTCRPALLYDDVRYFQLPLGGLTPADALALFELRGVLASDAHTRRLIVEAQSLTNGHPLWLNLIATQVSKNKVRLEDLVASIRRGNAVDLPVTMLRSIWKTLPDKQRSVLRCMAEAIRPESEEQIAAYLKGEINWNQCSKAIRSLRTLDLIVVKSSAPLATELLELHPLVKQFIRREFPKAERQRFIARIAAFFDTFIKQFTSSLEKRATFWTMEHWTIRAELALNAGDYETALMILNQVGPPIISAGYAEEFARVAGRLFAEIDWSSKATVEIRLFDDVFESFVAMLSHMGRVDSAEFFLNRYESLIEGQSARYIALCSMRTYLYWAQERFELAIEWGNRGVAVKSRSGLDTRHTSEHHLALAKRDSGDVEGALEFFLHGRSLESVIDVKSEIADSAYDEKDGALFGNVGRCLWKKGMVREALACYWKSANALENEVSQHSLTNRGWAALWIGEALSGIAGEVDVAYCFLRRAEVLWRYVSPPKAELARTAAERLASSRTQLVLAYGDERRVERECLKWLESIPHSIASMSSAPATAQPPRAPADDTPSEPRP